MRYEDVFFFLVRFVENVGRLRDNTSSVSGDVPKLFLLGGRGGG